MDLGAYAAWPHLMENSMRTIPGPYALPHYRCIMNGVLTHKTPAGPYRGAGRPQGNFVTERMMDRVAESIGMDPAEVRRRNFISSDQMPYKHPIGRIYDSGDYCKALDEALKLIEYSQWRGKRQPSRDAESFIGVGLASYTEDTGWAGAYEGALLRLEFDGIMTVYSGAPASGQGHETTFAQVVAHYFHIPLDHVRVIATDTSAPLQSGLGTFSSRSAGIAAGAIWESCKKLETRLKQLAECLLEASTDDLELKNGGIEVKGSPDKRVSFRELGEAANGTPLWPLRPGLVPGAEATAYMRSQGQYAFGTHACVVEVRRLTGEVKLLRYAVVHDCGTLLNPMIVTGQVHGGVAQGVGTALLEELLYDENGQLQNGSYMDYLLPTSGDLPAISVEHLEFPSPFTPTGAKGAGEGGTIPTLACVANAVEDALKPLGVRIRQLPITPDRLHDLMNARGGK
jgi:carbon-monoxide dehydrogenase large subunit